MLNFNLHGTPTDLTPLLIAHGLFGSARNWGVIARRMADKRLVVAVDMRNHGTSGWTTTHRYPDMAADLAEVIAAHGGTADVLGHSMGGKAAMQLALTLGDCLRRLVVADIAPVAYNHSQNHLIEAMRGLDLTDLASRREADRRLAQTIDEAPMRAFLLQSLDLKATPPRWRLTLDVLQAEMGALTGWPGTSGQFDGPALFLTGATSDYVQPGDRAGIKALFPNAKFAKIPGAGHMLHAEEPRKFEDTLRVFLGG
jgi:pimeloyl-ACP methyl ester carboxylesterase